MKILIIRFSSIGDIVLTSPVVRCLKEQLNGVELHFLTKRKFLEVMEHNPYLSKTWTIDRQVGEVIEDLRREKFDLIIDLHHNLRTSLVKRKLGVKSFSFNKLNFKKWVLVRFKKDFLPKIHIVERYLETVKSLHIQNDGKGLDLFLSENIREKVNTLSLPERFIAFAIGAQFATKILPTDKIIELINKIDVPCVLLGGPTDAERAEEICEKTFGKQLINLVGQISLLESAGVLQKAVLVITHDTGLMHFASAFKVPTVSIWGNTVPELGMYPYMNSDQYSIHQVVELSCRPCSKIGFERCPKGHFSCMNKQDLSAIAMDIISRWKKTI